MNKPEAPGATIPLAYAAEIAFELCQMRGECSEAARLLLRHDTPDESALNECAVFDEALAKAQAILLGAINIIQTSRSRR